MPSQYRVPPGTYECAICLARFTSDRAFQAHRTGPWNKRRCLTADEIAALRRPTGEPAWELDERGRWRERKKVPALALA